MHRNRWGYQNGKEVWRNAHVSWSLLVLVGVPKGRVKSDVIQIFPTTIIERALALIPLGIPCAFSSWQFPKCSMVERIKQRMLFFRPIKKPYGFMGLEGCVEYHVDSYGFREFGCNPYQFIYVVRGLTRTAS